MDWLSVDNKGVGKLLDIRNKAFVLFELVQMAWEEDINRVDISIAP